MKKGSKKKPSMKVVSMPAPEVELPDLEDHFFGIPEAFASAALNGLIAGMSEEDKNASFDDIRLALVRESWRLSDLMTAEASKRYLGGPARDDKQLPLPLDAGAPRAEG